MRARVVLPLVVLAALGWALADGDVGLPAWWSLRRDLAGAEQRILALREEIAQLRHEQQALRDDPLTLERAIREELELARPGEVVVRFSTP